MIHHKRYEKLISHYKLNLPEGYVEKHHIIPKCMGGDDSLDNLVLLPVRAHFIAHYLLYKMYPENKKIAHAFAMMMVNNKFQHRSSKLYEKAKIARSSALKGVPRPEWVKEKMRKPKQNKENYKHNKSNIHKLNISKSLKGKRKHPDSIKKSVESKQGYFQKIKLATEQKINYYRNCFIQSGTTRKIFYNLHPEISTNTLKKYLRGL